MSRAGIVGLLLVLAVVGYVVSTSLSTGAHTCEVCMEYHGRSQCRTVAAATVDLARDGAIQNACAYIAGGVTDGMACHREKPVRESCQ
ncbi:MAG TPA: hypothetical protein VN634_20015 [Candidatus Limnocylindrales bacterium]|jgi:hypothetical protein|nr:hypothetical protein [Candidatus Limnocylindrales bacterium]